MYAGRRPAWSARELVNVGAMAWHICLAVSMIQFFLAAAHKAYHVRGNGQVDLRRAYP